MLRSIIDELVSRSRNAQTADLIFAVITFLIVGLILILAPIVLHAIRLPTLSPMEKSKLAHSEVYMVTGNGWRHHDVQYDVHHGYEFGVVSSKYVSDDYWTYDPVFLFSNVYLTRGKFGQGEADGTDPFEIEAVSVKVGTAAPVAYQAKRQLAGGESWLSKPPQEQTITIPPRTNVLVSYSIAFNPGGKRVGIAQGQRPYFGERSEYGPRSLTNKVMQPETISMLNPGGDRIYPTGLIGAFAKGWDGRPVVLGLGTSISNGAGTVRTTSGPFGERGYLDFGMTAQGQNSKRLPHLNWSRNGAYASGIHRGGEGLSKRAGALALLPNTPFTTVFSELGSNDQTPNTMAWRNAIFGMLEGVKKTFPAARLVQVTFVPRTHSTDGFQSVEKQRPIKNWSSWPNSNAATVEAWMLNGQTPADIVVDWRKHWDGRDEGGRVGIFRSDLLEGFSAKLMTGQIKGDRVIHLDAVPRLGTPLAIDVQGRIEVRTVFDVSGYEAPYQVTLTTYTGDAGFQYDHPAGAKVVEAIIDDGVHPSSSLSEYIGSAFFPQLKALF